MTTMKAVRLHEYGASTHLKVDEVDRPSAAQGQVVISVKFAGLRWGDIMQRNGKPSRMLQPPFTVGQEAVGIVKSVGPEVSNVTEGTTVLALPTNGAYAEELVADASRLIPVPKDVPMEQFIQYPVNLRTAWFIVYVWAKIEDGETVLLHSAAGGVGLLVLQIIKKKFNNVRVIGITSSKKKYDLLKEHGCDHVINRLEEDYVARVLEITGPKLTGFRPVGDFEGGGVHASLNGVSGATIEQDPAVIRKRGRWILYGYTGGKKDLNLSSLDYDGVTVKWVSSLAWMGTREGTEAEAFVANWVQSEKLLAPEIWPLDSVAAAQDALEAGETTGKVVFKI